VRWIIHQPSCRRTLLQPGTAALRFGCGFAALRLCVEFRRHLSNLKAIRPVVKTGLFC
jgi:prolipoprotein diacylglyceryltransferase